jgi:hypothetical protein
MTMIAIGIFLEIILMGVFGGIKFLGFGAFCDDGFGPFA